MKFKIVADSSCDLTKDYIQDQEVGFDIASLSILVNNKVYTDNDNINIPDMLNDISSTSAKATSSCPNPAEYIAKYADAENVFCVTISSKLSGSYNSACLAAKECPNQNILVIDSKLTSGAMILIVDELYRLIKLGLSFEEISKAILQYRDERKLYFSLDKFDNLVKNGRINKAIAFIATILKIKPLLYGNEGEIKILQKVRTRKAVITRLIEYVCELDIDFSQRECIITHCLDEETATLIESHLKNTCSFGRVRVLPMRGLCSFYALEKGIIVSI